MRVLILGDSPRFMEVLTDVAKAGAEVVALANKPFMRSRLQKMGVECTLSDFTEPDPLQKFPLNGIDLILICLEDVLFIKHFLEVLDRKTLTIPTLVLTTDPIDFLKKKYPYVDFVEYQNLFFHEISKTFQKKLAFVRLKKLFRLFQKEDRLLILIRPDPDSIASALAMQILLKRHLHSSTISYVGEITRPENLLLIKLLRIRLFRLWQVQHKDFTKFAIVDNQPSHFLSLPFSHCDVIIDHHPITEGSSATFRDIRPSYGATATILTEYLTAAKTRISSKLATALVYAIRTDTNNFTRKVRSEDMQAFFSCFPMADQEAIKSIESSEIPLDSLKYFQMAFNKMKKEEERSFVHLGRVEFDDIGVMIAEFLLRVKELSLVIVSEIHKRKLIIIFRNAGLGQDIGAIAHRAFNDLGSAGGHKSAARAEIPLSNLKKKIPSLEEKEIEDFILSKLSL